jgi:hypothetical protein
MGTSADLLDFIARGHGKDDPPAVHFYDLRAQQSQITSHLAVWLTSQNVKALR